MASRAVAGPTAPRIWRTCAEWAEAGWLAARGRGMADPVVELWALDEADPGRVIIAVAERERLAHTLAPRCPPAVADLRAVPPGRPFSVVILTPSGINVDHRPASGEACRIPQAGTGDGLLPGRRDAGRGSDEEEDHEMGADRRYVGPTQG